MSISNPVVAVAAFATLVPVMPPVLVLSIAATTPNKFVPPLSRPLPLFTVPLPRKVLTAPEALRLTWST